MQELEDIALLRQFAASRSEAAFEQLVSRHAGFVHSAALRQVRDPQLAAEITQAVFLILARKAARLSDKTILTGWLFKTTRFVALAQVRAEVKRRQHEQETQMHTQLQTEPSSDAGDQAWSELAPLLDQALAHLGETDRQAVLLRFFENKSLAEVGHKLGAGEDTARKRVSRALEKLRKFFAKRGAFYTTAIIAAAISANAVQAAPAGVVATIPAMAVKGSAAAVSTVTLVKEALQLMTIAKLKTAAVVAAATVLAASGTVVVNRVVAQEKVDESVWGIDNSKDFFALPPTFILRPTHYANVRVGHGFGGAGYGSMPPGLQLLARDISFAQLMAEAFDLDGFTNRVVLPPGAPTTGFDLLMVGPRATEGKLQSEIKRQFGYTAHFEPRPADVFLLSVSQPGAPGLQPSQGGGRRGGSGGSVGGAIGSMNMNLHETSITSFVTSLEHYFQKPILDRSGLTEKYDISLHVTWGNGVSESDGFIAALRDQLGLALTPGREPLDHLIVEAATAN